MTTLWSRLALVVVLLWTLLPIYWFLKISLLTPDEIARFPPPLYPLAPTPAAFLNIFGFDYTLADGTVRRGSGQAAQILRGLGNSLIVSFVVTIVTLVVVVPLAYVFARLEFRHKNTLLFAILLAVALPPVSTLIPFYAMYIRLGLAGTLSGLILVTLTITIPFVTWMLIGYFRNLPPIERLARIDGYSRFETFLLHRGAARQERYRSRGGDRVPVRVERVHLCPGAGEWHQGQHLADRDLRLPVPASGALAPCRLAGAEHPAAGARGILPATAHRRDEPG